MEIEDAVANMTLQSEPASRSSLHYFYFDMWQASVDARVSQYPLMEGGPWPVLAIIAAYVYFVKVLGPDLMQHRKPFNMKPIILAYNVLMVLINSFFFYVLARRTNFGLRTWQCNPLSQYNRADDKEWQFIVYVGWLFVMSKFVDLLDTVFFVLRKNFHQVSALHVIHHSLVPINCWFGLKYVPSESVAFLPFINSFVHAVMYSYYALSSLGPHMRPYLWWKKYLTSIQIIQLALVTLHCVFLALNSACNLPKFCFVAGAPQVLLILYMFTTFFRRAYVNQPHVASASRAVVEKRE